MESCRPAGRQDLPFVVEMARALRGEIEPIRGGPLWGRREGRAEPLEAAYEALLDRPDLAFLVGTVDDAVVGFGVGEVATLHDGARLGIVSDLYVDPEARGVGVGEAIADALVAWFEAQGCIGADALALPGHRLTKNFFEEQGFVSRLIVMHRRLGAAADPGTAAGEG